MDSKERGELYEYLKARKLCVDCRNQDERTLRGLTRCAKCAERARLYNYRYTRVLEDKREKLKERFCCDYCRYPHDWNELEEGMELSESDVCANCPLNDL